MDVLLRIEGLHFQYGAQPIIQGVDLELGAGEVMVVLGPSGCGKSTLLRLIAGLERPAAGSIGLAGRPLSGPGVFVPPEKRPVGMVFQGLALFPHLTVARNVGFGLRHVPKAERARRVAEELAAVGLDGLGGRYPHQLSGGQQQRVAVARSLVRRPALLLMDEPFSDLDEVTRRQVRTEVLRILKAHGTAAIIVSHDRADALHLGDRIVLMDQGRSLRTTTPAMLRAEWTTETRTP